MIAPLFTDNKYKLTVKIGGREEPAPAPVIEKIEEPALETIQTEGFTTFQATPHNTIRNEKNDRFAEVLADTYQELFQAWRTGTLGKRERVFFETVLTETSYETFVSASDPVADMAKQQVMMAWKHVTVTPAERKHLKAFEDPKQVAAYDLKLKYHFFLSLKTDRKLTETPLAEILELSRFMSDGDTAVIQFGFQAAEEDWVKDAEIEEREFMKKRPSGWSKSREINTSTQLKTTHQGFDFVLRVAVHSQDERRRRRIARGLCIALKQLNHDNELVEREIGRFARKKWLEGFRSFKLPVPIFYSKRQILTEPEIGRFLNFPQASLQQEYPFIKANASKEINIDAELRKGGYYLGDATFRGEKIPVSIQTKKERWDEYCQQSVVVGGPGQGKTIGHGANAIVEAVHNGFGAMAIDPAKGQIGDEVERALPKSLVERYNVAKMLFSLDWNEVKYAKKGAKNMLADSVLAFFEDNTDSAGSQTIRFLEAAVYGMQTGRLAEVVKILLKKPYCQEVIQKMPDTIHRSTLEELNGYTDARRMQIVAPVLNRLNVVFGDQWLSQCMESSNSIDMYQLLMKKKAIIFDVLAKDGLTEKQIDLIVNLLTTKIALAMKLRAEEDQFPFTIVYDEPHQYLRSARLWKHLAVESRKWRVKFIWMFHDWEQIQPDSLRKIIKSALPHYHLYPSSKHTFKDLEDEIFPFTYQEAMRLQKHHAINVIRTKNGVAQPIIVRMALPPSERKAKPSEAA